MPSRCKCQHWFGTCSDGPSAQRVRGGPHGVVTGWSTIARRTEPSQYYFDTVTLNFGIVPAGSAAATGGTTYARFRISTDAASVASPTGLAPDGEAES